MTDDPDAPQPAPPPHAPPPPPPPPAPAHPPPAPPLVGPGAGELAIKRSFVRVALCSVASFGIYGYWWFYVYRQRLNAELGKSDDPALHTAGLFVPILNIYLIYLFWTDISDARVRVGLAEIPVVAYLVGSLFVAPVFFGLVNAQLNEYWDHRTGGQATDAPFTTGEKLAIFIPLVTVGGLWLLVILVLVAASASL